MTDRTEPPRPPGWENARWGESSQTPNAQGTKPQSAPQSGPADAPRESALARFMGGSPLVVVARLALISLAVGALLMWLDIRPDEIFYALRRLVHRISSMGMDAVREIFGYMVAGAFIVVPIWLIARLFSARR